MKRIFVMAGAESLEGYKCFPVCESEVELLPINCSPDAVRCRDLDILLIDCGYDDGIGLAFLARFKTHRPDVPVIFITDAGSEAVAVAAFRLGARDYFKKPVNFFLLGGRVENIIRLRRESGEWRVPLPVENCEKICPDGGSLTSCASPGILRAISYIEKNPAAQFTIDDIAGKAGMSKFHFCRSFKKATGVSPKAFVNARRVARAKELLCRDDLHISTVALKSGFNDFSNFIRSFKIVTGLTPTAYRECVRQ